jgi:protein-disulfide isomerase
MYGDYTCPYTQRASAFVGVACRKLGRKMRYVFRDFPREELHPEASLLAEAAHAAAAQGRFWEMHEALLQGGDDPVDPGAIAALLGLDLERFASELQARVHRAHVAHEVDGALESGVTGTPTLFINGKRHVGTWEGSSLLRALGGAPAMARSAHL